jgi:hypothetical protein
MYQKETKNDKSLRHKGEMIKTQHKGRRYVKRVDEEIQVGKD